MFHWVRFRKFKHTHARTKEADVPECSGGLYIPIFIVPF